MSTASPVNGEKTFDPTLLYPSSQYAQPDRPDISEETLKKFQKLTEHFTNVALELPIDEADSGEKRKLNEREMMFLSRETFERFLTATKGDVTQAITRLENAVVWRRSVNIDDVEAMAEDCEVESRCGKNFVMGFSTKRQPVIYFFPSRNTTPIEQRRAINAIFSLERARDLMPIDVTSVTVIFSFVGKRQGPPTSVSVARQVLNILSSHYPETLASSIFLDMPWIAKAFVNLMWPFVDPVTKKKVKFGSSSDKEIVSSGEIAADQLLEECGGDLNMPYHHESYYKSLIETCLNRRKEQEELFRKGPAIVGRSEREWRGLYTYEEGETVKPSNSSID